MVCASLQSIYHMTKAVQAVVDCIVVVGVLTCCALFQSVWDFKVTQMNMKQSNSGTYALWVQTELCYCGSNQKICCAKGKSTVNYSTVTRWFMKFHSGFKNLNDQAKNHGYRGCAWNHRNKLGKYQVSLSFHNTATVITFMTSLKAFEAAEFCLTLAKYCKTFDSPGCSLLRLAQRPWILYSSSCFLAVTYLSIMRADHCLTLVIW